MYDGASSLTKATAVILAGGFGMRLRSVIADRPKVLAEIHGRPFLTYLLDQVAAAGITQVVLSTGHLGEQVRATFGDAYRSLRLAYSQETEPLGTAGALRLALPLLTSETILAMNGDSFCQANLDAFWQWHIAQKAAVSLLLTRVLDTNRYGRVEVAPDGQVLSFIEKGTSAGPGWISAGIYLLKRDLLSTIPPGRAVSIEKESFPAWVGRGLYGYQSQGQFLDIGTPESYAHAETFFVPS